MSAKKIVGGLLFIAGAALTLTGVGAAIGIPLMVSQAVGLGLMVASSMLLGPAVPKMPSSLAGGGRDRLFASLDVRAPRKILFGDTAGPIDTAYRAFVR